MIAVAAAGRIFLRRVPTDMRKSFDGLSGIVRGELGRDPLAFVDMAIRRYEELRVNPKLKYIVFSDSLDVEKAIQIKHYCGDRITATFGIGTNLTNDVGNGIKGLNIVMKLFRCKMIEKDRWNECIKLSDVAGKHTGSVEEIQLAQRVLGIGG